MRMSYSEQRAKFVAEDPKLSNEFELQLFLPRFHQQRKRATRHGDEAGLKNAWDEICAQLQFEESFSWDVSPSL
jgi:hypothetical protein